MKLRSVISRDPTEMLTAFCEAVRQWAFDSGNLDQLGKILQNYADAQPELVEALFPGHYLARRPLTPKERGKIAIAAANAKRARLRAERLTELKPIIHKLRCENAAISLRELAARLDLMGVKPARAKNWTVGSVALLLKGLQNGTEPIED